MRRQPPATRLRARRRRRPVGAVLLRNLLLFLVALVSAGVALGLVFAGSPTRIADGVHIDGVDVGGLEASSARALLQRRAALLQGEPVVFVAAGHRFPITASELGVESDWKAAVAAARRQGDGFGPLRGFRRIDVQVFGADVTPPARVLEGALAYELSLIAAKVDRPHREAALVRHGTAVSISPAQAGLVLDRKAAADVIVRTLASLQRPRGAVRLPLRVDPARIRAPQLQRAARQARIALSAPVGLTAGTTHRVVPPSRLARLLELPSGGRTTLRIGGPEAERWLAQLGRRVETQPHDATFAIDGTHVSIVPSRPGLQLDALRSAQAILHAALRRTGREATLAVTRQPARITTARARAMGITGVVSSYTTEYGGEPNRIHNVELVAHLVDGKLIAPGATFSFNGATGARTAAKGFLEAPVIINGELTTGLGGGVCQVSTTVFNAAFEAGVPITERVNHALYISHYPQGRDATVDYPDVDLRFVNDTGHWLLLHTDVGPSSLTVSLFGAPTDRKVESTTGPLVAHGKIPVEKTVDPSLKPGQRVVDDPGVPAQTTSVTRDVYTADGKLLYHDVWYSSYRAEPKLVRVGPKPRKHAHAGKKKPGKAATQPAATTSTAPTTPASTTPATAPAPPAAPPTR